MKEKRRLNPKSFENFVILLKSIMECLFNINLKINLKFPEFLRGIYFSIPEFPEAMILLKIKDKISYLIIKVMQEAAWVVWSVEDFLGVTPSRLNPLSMKY